MNRIGEQGVFVTAHYDRAGRLLALERWDRGIDPGREEDERSLLDLTLTNLGFLCRPQRDRGFRMELIEKWEYEGLIDLNLPGRTGKIRWGQNLQDYRPLS